MPETLDTLGEKIAALTARFGGLDDRFDSVDKRFDGVDKRFDSVDNRFDEMRSELKTQIEAVDAKVGLVLEKVESLIARDVSHSITHAGFELQLENHELRLTALEAGRKPGGGPESH